jgi:hypothetical protein
MRSVRSFDRLRTSSELVEEGMQIFFNSLIQLDL